MANPDHIELLLQGKEVWNRWRNDYTLGVAHLEDRDDFLDVVNELSKKDSAIVPDLSGADLRGIDLDGFSFYVTRLEGAELGGVNLRNNYCGYANFRKAKLRGANLLGSNLGHANFQEADLGGATFQSAVADDVEFGRANLLSADFRESKLRGSRFSGAILGSTVFGLTDMRDATGLDECDHWRPSVLDHHTIQKSGGLPLKFLRGCGLPDTYIEYLPSLLGQPFEFYSCFISHSSRDEEFVRRLYADLQNAGVRCYYAPEELKGGQKLHDQLMEAIRFHDKLLLVLSRSSLDSEWVKAEIRAAYKRALREKRRVLFPISLLSFEELQGWELFDADVGRDLAAEIRELYIQDFRRWKEHDTYQAAFKRLLRDLKTAN